MASDPIQRLRSLPADERIRVIARLDDDAAASLLYDWSLWAREDQKEPTDPYRVWLLLHGRGAGKTRTGSETVIRWSDHYPRIALIGPSAGDVRDVMVEGVSGILRCSPPWNRPVYEPSKRRLTWPNGAIATTFSAEDPEQLRGPQFHRAWADELCAWQYDEETWDMMSFGLRLRPSDGTPPRAIVTTTPKPRPLIRKIRDLPSTVVSSGSTFLNSENLSADYLESLRERYEGTDLGRQEIYGEILDDAEGALWSREMINAGRVDGHPDNVLRRVVAVDPAITSSETSDETGIIVAHTSISRRDRTAHYYVTRDLSTRGTPLDWARAAVAAYRASDADVIVAEANQGGDMVRSTIRQVDPHVPIRLVRASKGKIARAEPIALLYEQGRVHHVGTMIELEDQLVYYTGRAKDKSPDRMDALVWAISDLMSSSAVPRGHVPWGGGERKSVTDLRP